jgi:hypothetical protein
VDLYGRERSGMVWLGWQGAYGRDLERSGQSRRGIAGKEGNGVAGCVSERNGLVSLGWHIHGAFPISGKARRGWQG